MMTARFFFRMKNNQKIFDKKIDDEHIQQSKINRNRYTFF